MRPASGSWPSRRRVVSASVGTGGTPHRPHSQLGQFGLCMRFHRLVPPSSRMRSPSAIQATDCSVPAARRRGRSRSQSTADVRGRLRCAPRDRSSGSVGTRARSRCALRRRREPPEHGRRPHVGAHRRQQRIVFRELPAGFTTDAEHKQRVGALRTRAASGNQGKFVYRQRRGHGWKRVAYTPFPYGHRRVRRNLYLRLSVRHHDGNRRLRAHLGVARHAVRHA